MVSGIDEMLDALSAAPHTYQSTGSDVELPPAGYRRTFSVRTVRISGSSESAWDRASNRLMTWEVHRRVGMQVHAVDERVVVGGVAVLRLGIGRLAFTAPVRVVDVIYEEHRRGFVYATLPGHPVSGAELFLLSRDSSAPDVITAAVTAVSRPAAAVMRLAGPIGRWGQRTVARRYAREMIRGRCRHRARAAQPQPSPGPVYRTLLGSGRFQQLRARVIGARSVLGAGFVALHADRLNPVRSVTSR